MTNQTPAPVNTASPLILSAQSTLTSPVLESLHQQQHASAKTSRLDWIASLDMDRAPSCTLRKTSIICTIGPATNSVEAMVQLRKAGMNIVRLNFSHGTHEYHASVVQNARDSFKVYSGRPVAIALDTKGPEIRSGTLSDPKGVIIEAGSELIVTTDESRSANGDASTIYVDYKKLAQTVKPGGKIFMDDGILSLTVLSCHDNYVKVKANNTHRLLHHKGVNLPEAKLELPAVSEKDVEDLGFAVKHGLDMIFASFIRKAQDVLTIREKLGEAGKSIKIIAKIENHEGVYNFNEILAVADGIMVARGDLGIEIPPSKVFICQKMMISRCNLAGKPVICATQMLESMTQNPRPTRAEASDVANAVLDGADCVMLSAETARGQYPNECVSIMSQICLEAEATISYAPLFNELRIAAFQSKGDITETLACAAVNAALEPYIEAIIVLTTTGNSARQVAKFRPAVPILCVTRHPEVARQIHLYRGCYPLLYDETASTPVSATAVTSRLQQLSTAATARKAAPGTETPKEGGAWQDNVDQRLHWAMQEGKRSGLLRAGWHVVAIQGWRGGHGNTNTMRILQVL